MSEEDLEELKEQEIFIPNEYNTTSRRKHVVVQSTLGKVSKEGGERRSRSKILSVKLRDMQTAKRKEERNRTKQNSGGKEKCQQQ